MSGSTTSLAQLGERRRRVVLYSHDTMGIGHMRRNVLIAQTLSGPPISASILLIAGAKEINSLQLPANVDCLTLPSLGKSETGAYRSRRLELSLAQLIDLRSKTIAAAVRSFAPDLLIADKEPRGALGELEPTLAELRGTGQTRCVLGLRDVLDDPATVRHEWAAAGNTEAIHDYYDAVWIYGDPDVYDMAREYGLSDAVRGKLSYIGYLDAWQRLRAGKSKEAIQSRWGNQPFALCMVGGGQDGAQLAEAFANAELPKGMSGVVVTGPYLPSETAARLKQQAAANSRLRVLDFVSEPCRLLQRADRVVTMGGYNTVSEILAFEKSALVVPRVSPRQEQWIRAQRFSELGLLDVLHPQQLDSAALSRWLARRPSPLPRARRLIDLDGARRLPRLVRSILHEPPRRTSSNPGGRSEGGPRVAR